MGKPLEMAKNRPFYVKLTYFDHPEDYDHLGSHTNFSRKTTLTVETFRYLNLKKLLNRNF